MPEYLSPGVYVEEIDTGSKPIEGVSTSTAGFVGVTRRGPVDGTPLLITSFTEFRRVFGGYLPETWGDSRFLAYAVQGFFENEGQRVYIKRVPGEGAVRSSQNVFNGIVTRLQADAPMNATHVRLASPRGVSNATNLTFEEVGSGVAPQTVQVTSYDSNSGEVVLNAPLGRAYSQAATTVTVGGAPAVTPLKIQARDHGLWGDDIRVKFESTTPARSELASGVSLSLPATTSLLLHLSVDVPVGATQATLTAGEGARVHPGDWVELSEGAAREQRQVTGIVADDISWTDALTNPNPYTAAGATARLLTLARPLTLTTGPKPGAPPSATRAILAASEAQLVQVNDWIELSDGTNRERRQVTGVNLGTNTISWTGDVEHDYTGGIIRMLTAVRQNDESMLLPSVAGLAAGNVLTITGGGHSDDVTIHSSWVAGHNEVPLTAAIGQSYLEGATVAFKTAAAHAGANSVRVRSARAFYPGARVELDNGTNREYFNITDITGNDLKLSGALANNYNIGNFVRLAEFRMSVRYVNPEERIDQLETFDGLTMNSSVTTRYAITVVNARSTLVRFDTSVPFPPFDNPTTLDGSWQQLAGGDDGTPPLDDAFIGEDFGPGQRTGLQSMIDIDQVSIVAVPGKTSQAIQNALIEHCESLMDRFAVLDAPAGASIQTVQDFRNQYDTKYAAIYYPWITVRDSLVKDRRNVPPSGHMVGIYARVDETRGVHKAPANEVIRGILDLEQIVNKREQDILNPSPVNINVLRDFRASGRGMRVWGARCITSDTDWKYINVRRLFIFLEESIDEGTQWAVFEPNDEPLWARVRQSVVNFLTRVWRDGALMGTKPEEAFFVKCDRTTMTQDDIDNGRLIMIIGVAPVKPAEFVIIRIGQFAGGSEVVEL
jgi:uncharacterized protein